MGGGQRREAGGRQGGINPAAAAVPSLPAEGAPAGGLELTRAGENRREALAERVEKTAPA